MGDFIKKWFHLLLIFVFAYLAGSLAGQANSRFRSVNGIPIYSASADGNWGLSFPNPGQSPVGNTTNDYLKQFNACYMGDPGETLLPQLSDLIHKDLRIIGGKHTRLCGCCIP